ncbi:MAG: response regulator [Chloroflexi bacterium]|nr:response regulator [Chloroflexota bacterium]
MMAVILVVEDSLTVSTAVQGMLCKHGYTVRVAGDGLVALSALRTFQPDLVLLDIRLPHVDGYQLCHVIRRQSKYQHLPIVMLSGLSGADDMQRALEAGADDYLVKPVDEKILLATVEMHLVQAEIRTG